MTKIATVSSPPMLNEAKNVKTKQGKCKSFFFSFLLEREGLLSRIPTNLIIDSLRDKKESRSTWSDLRVGTGFVSFRQTP